MKKILWLLLVLNGLAAATWLAGFSLPPKSPAQLTVPTPDARRLQLLSELPELPPRMGEAEVASDTTPSVADDVMSPAETREEFPPPPAASSEPESTASATQTPSSTGPEVARPATASQTTATTETEPSSVPTAALVCYQTGSLSSNAHEAAGAELREARVSHLKLSELGRSRPRYWVFWSGSLGEADTVEQRLKEAAVRDWYRFRGAEGGAGISLGVFGQRDTAEQHQRNLAAKGVQAQIGERYAPQAQLRWTFSVDAANVDALKTRMQRQHVSLEACP